MRIMNLSLLCWACCVTFAWAQEASIMNPEATKAALAQIGQATQANFDRIRTWRGTWSRQTTSFYRRPEANEALKALAVPETVMEVVAPISVTVDFAFDRPSGQLFAHSNRQDGSFLDNVTGKKLRILGKVSLLDHSVLWTRDRFLRAHDARWDENDRPIREGSIHQVPQRDDADLLSCTDPRRLFGFESDRPTWDGLVEVARWAQNRHPDDIQAAATTQPDQQGYWVEQVREQPRLYRLVTMAKKPQQNLDLLVEYWFDEAVAFNLVRADSTSAGLRRGHREFSYQEINGVFLPHRILRESFTSQGEIHWRDELSLAISHLNEELPPEQFTLQSLGLSNGERVVDKIHGGEFQYVDGTLASRPAP